MRAISFIMAIVVLFPAQAFDVINLTNLNGQFNGKQGEVSVDQFKFYTPEFGAKVDNVLATIEKSENNFYLNYRDTYFVYRPQKESIIHGIDKLFFSGVTFNYEPGHLFQFQTSGLEIYQESGSQRLPKLIFKCRKLASQKSLEEDLISPCLDAASLEIPRLSLQGLSASKVESIIGNKVALDTLENIKVNVYKKSFTLSLKADYIFNWTIKSSGTIDYLPASGELRLYIREARAGIFNVKKRLLRELKAAGADSIRIIGDRIFIKL